MSARTIFLSKLIGLFLLLVGLSMLIQGQAMAETADGIMHDRPLVYMVGMLTLAGGLAMVLTHNRWSGGALAVVVTILGWILLLKGVLLLFLPPRMLIDLFGALRFGVLLYLYAAIDVVLGIFLTVGGFMAANTTEPSGAPSA
jgi:hypothetical protein